jgi:tetratricopeptide (TPR) repeat protein
MNKSDAEALLRQGIELYDIGRYQEAIVMFDRSLALYPNLAKAHYFKGIALYDLGKLEDAIKAYDQAVAI